MRAGEGQAQGHRPPRHPFGETANPDEYVPRDACEAVLRAVEDGLRAGRVTALCAPPGLGKSLLLRLAGRRLEPDFESVFLAYAALELDELCAWTLGLLGQECGSEPRRELLGAVRARGDEPVGLALLIDDAGAMPLETVRGLTGLVRDSGNRLRVALATADDAASSRVLAALPDELLTVPLRDVMSEAETWQYVETRLEQSQSGDSLRERFGPAVIGRIHRLSGGVPRRVNELAASVIERPPGTHAVPWSEEEWLGTPLDEVGASGSGREPPLSEGPDDDPAPARPAPGELESWADEDDPELR